MRSLNSLTDDILKIQRKLCTFEMGSRNYSKYMKILSKHIKRNSMKARVNSNIKTIEAIEKIRDEDLIAV